MEPAHPKGKDTILDPQGKTISTRLGSAVAGSASWDKSLGKHSDISRGK